MAGLGFQPGAMAVMVAGNLISTSSRCPAAFVNEVLAEGGEDGGDDRQGRRRPPARLEVVRTSEDSCWRASTSIWEEGERRCLQKKLHRKNSCRRVKV
jgi:hypothetical protein